MHDGSKEEPFIDHLCHDTMGSLAEAGVNFHCLSRNNEWRIDLNSRVNQIIVVKDIVFKVVDECLPDVSRKGLSTIVFKGLCVKEFIQWHRF